MFCLQAAANKPPDSTFEVFGTSHIVDSGGLLLLLFYFGSLLLRTNVFLQTYFILEVPTRSCMMSLWLT